MALEGFGFIPARERYINKCDLCTEIRHFIFNKEFNGSRELGPRGCYFPG
jgi:hypothetical protein